eukprot:CAMPEP_0119309636 /NCGR_PEP_ID=MMETSP1333-20130426/15878_1 /TAXON_ID=418940 /ORGANISM="Scyphosphaera apsteinii, Strain RCC1455" /LENGTH=194 /DNA_ID=CAMNT_0007313639 /DNA_START=281 /DNA_END=866 /DNA_ORIENTATION=+
MANAAANDMYNLCMQQAAKQIFFDTAAAGVDPERYYTRFQLKGLHCWLCHVRLRMEPRDACVHLFTDMMETLWEDAIKQMVKQEKLDLLQASKFLKELQEGWHGMCVALDQAILSEAPHEAVSTVLLRNVYATADGQVPQEHTSRSLWLSDYLLLQVEHMRALLSPEVLLGRISFKAPQPLCTERHKDASELAM